MSDYNRKLERQREYYQENKEKILQRHSKWREDNPNYRDNYRNTPFGRAHTLLSAYKTADKKHNRGEGDLTAQWIVDNIMNKPCVHCGKTGWENIGCNRIDNSKPHTKDNVEPCCRDCNDELNYDEKMKPLDQIDLISGEVIHQWSCVAECGKNGFSEDAVRKCCKNKYMRKGNNIYKKCIWKRYG